MQEFQVNDYLSLRLEDEHTVIYIDGKRFRQCKYLLLNISVDEIQSLDEIDSIDEAAERLNKSLEDIEQTEIEIPPEVEFWGHCSNLHVWYEHGYDTRLLHSNLAFPLLKKLSEAGDPLAREMLKREIIQRYKSGTEATRKFLTIENFLSYLNTDERLDLLLDKKDFQTLLRLCQEIDVNNPSKILEALLYCIEINNEKIVELNLKNFELSKFPFSILDFKWLEVLNLRSNLLTGIPRKINKLKYLKKLWLSNNKLRYVPSYIGNMKNLELIWLSDNKLRCLPESFGNLNKLKILHLYNNRLKNLPKTICKLNSLEKLYLNSNKLSRFPNHVVTLKSLKILDLRNNLLKDHDSLPKKIKKKGLKVLL